MATGDGRTPETAYVTISVGEGYAFLYLLRLQLVGRTTVKDEVGRPVGDVLIVKDNEGNELPLHFSPKAHFARIQAVSESVPAELFRRLEEAIGPPPDDPEEARKAILKWIRSRHPKREKRSRPHSGTSTYCDAAYCDAAHQRPAEIAVQAALLTDKKKPRLATGLR